MAKTISPPSETGRPSGTRRVARGQVWRAGVAPAWPSRRTAIACTLLLAMLFNAGLALLNAAGPALSPSVVIACEATITAVALLLGVDGRQPLKTRWIVLCVLIVSFGVVIGFGSGGFDPKFIRDVLIVPVFILLGLSSRRGDLLRITVRLQAVVLAFTLFEAVRPDDFARLFNVMAYYINTRGFQADSFWNSESDLFVSATRPGERFLFAFLDLHRLSSVFLEPVSLGNYCVIVAMITALLWTTLTLRQRVFLCASEFVILVGCDGRFATVSMVLLVLVRLVAPLLPRYSNVLTLPLILGLAAVMVRVGHVSPVGDDFPSRTAGSIAALASVTPAGWLGFAGPRAYSVMDSGIAYLVYSQALWGTLVLWGFVALGLPQRDRLAVACAHMVCLYLTLNLLISYSVFSIKTAALLWFTYGHMARHSGAYLARRRASRPSPRDPAAVRTFGGPEPVAPC